MSLPANHSLHKNDVGGHILGTRPYRQVQLQPEIFAMLENLLATEPKLYEYDRKQVHILFHLAAKGYLEISPKPWQPSISDYELPKVSIIIPVKNRPDDIRDCVTSLNKVQWQQGKVEIIVVDDGSTDETPRVAADLGVRVVGRDTSGGPAIARNDGAAVATGEILAFLDSDCTVGESWLAELVPWLVASGVGAVGGKVDSYYTTTPLDRYEEAMSSLIMGKRMLYEAAGKATFYVPTCNVLVKASVHAEIGGLNPEMHLGEDVDMCWRLRRQGYGLVYVTYGTALHKHRNQLRQMLKRRLEYGTSEADLYKRHHDKGKAFPMPISSLGIYLGIFLAILALEPWFLAVSFLGLVGSFVRKYWLSRQMSTSIKFWDLIKLVIRTNFAFCYYLNFHIIRYYLIFLCIVSIFCPTLLMALTLAFLICCIVDYGIKKPRLNFISFAFFYLLEQIYYQVGVFMGCFIHKSFKCYLVKMQLAV